MIFVQAMTPQPGSFSQHLLKGFAALWDDRWVHKWTGWRSKIYECTLAAAMPQHALCTSPAPAGPTSEHNASGTNNLHADEHQMVHRQMCKAGHRRKSCFTSSGKHLTALTLPNSTERAGVPRRSQLADVILSVGDQQVLAHSCVLCVWSEVFKALLTRWSAQRTSNGAAAAAVTVDLSPGDSPEDFLELLHYCYVGTCQVSRRSARPSG